jgi:hypothetical protein
MVTINNEKIEPMQGSFCWSEWGKGLCADTAGPLELAEEMAPFVAEKGETVNLEFEKKPTAVSVYQVETDEPIRQSASLDSFQLPQQEGTYIFDIVADWRQGDVSYVIKIAIE